MRVEITEAQPHHCGQITRLLRADHHAMLMQRNVYVHQQIRSHFDKSYYRRSAFVDDHLVAVWGAEGSLMGWTAFIWVALSQYALKFPVTVLRQARREISQIAKTKEQIVTTVIAEDEPAQRLVAFLGFESPDGFGGGPARSASSRRNLMRYIRTTPEEIMVNTGDSRQIALVWRREWNEVR